MSRAALTALTIRGITFAWGTRTYVMGILNATPDSFSGDGLLGAGGEPGDLLERAVAHATRMAAEGADLLDIGGESTRPGHRAVSEADELARVAPIVAAVRSALPAMPLSVDTTKPAVAEAALDAGADLLNDVSGTSADGALARIAAARRVPLVLMHGGAPRRSGDLVADVAADLGDAVARAVEAGCDPGAIVLDPGFGFGKTPVENLALLRDLARVRELGYPILIGTSRKSTIGRVLGLPADQRLEGTLATTALGIAGGADVIRVHDVAANVRAARMADAIVRGWDDPEMAR